MLRTQVDDSPYEIPQSRGVPMPVRILVAIGLAVILYMGAISALFSKPFHIWPAARSAKIELPRGF